MKNKVIAFAVTLITFISLAVPAYAEELKTPFTDIDMWAKSSIEWSYKNKIVVGTSSTTFSPNVNMSRGMLVTILYRLAGNPDMALNNSEFPDVKKTDYFYDAVLW